MKVAIFSESPADEAALRILADAVLGAPTTRVEIPPIRARGWAAVINLLPKVIQHLHYQTDAQALVVVLDSDESTPHESGHDESATPPPDCRFCQMRGQYTRIVSHLRPIPARQPLRLTFGLAVPTIEAWLLCDRQPHLSEVTWKQILASQSRRYSKQSLKRDLYGTARPTLQEETNAMVQRAAELALNLPLLESRFPGGFQPLVCALRQP
jgi:hypothetical protein